MKKNLTAVLVLLCLLSSLFGDTAASAMERRAVTTERAVAFEPLDGKARIAYEQHTAGYAVSLNGSAEGVLAQISAVPSGEEGREAENVRLYLQTGVTPRPGVTCRVSFDLTAERALPDYGVVFDGGEREGAYGSLEGRNVPAGGTDRVKAFVTPDSANGELIVRLLLGKTEANTVRIRNLSVEEASEAEIAVGLNVLADKLNYHAPGSIRCWASDDSGASLTVTEGSATLTVTQAPKNGAEVWKIKLLAATGLRPMAGKAYRIRADLTSRAKQLFEVCYNEGDVEKGYDVLYEQRLTGGTQTLDRTIYIPTDKTNAGEIILQVSLGKLQTGDAVTIHNIQVEEAVMQCTDILPQDFSFDAEPSTLGVEYEEKETGTTAQSIHIDWAAQTMAWETHDDDYTVSLDKSADRAVLDISQAPQDRGVWKTKLFLRTGVTPDTGETYRVSFRIRGERTQGEYEVLLDGEGTPDSDRDYGAFTGQRLASSAEIREFYCSPANDAGELRLIFQLGKTDDTSGNRVSVDSLRVERVTLDAREILPDSFSYRSESHLEKAGENAGALTAAETEATLEYSAGGEGYHAQMILRTGLIPEPDTAYAVRFTVQARHEQDGDVSILYGTPADEGAYSRLDGQSLSTEEREIRHVFPVTEVRGELAVRLQVGKTSEDNAVTVRDLMIWKQTPAESEEPLNGDPFFSAWAMEPEYAAELDADGDTASLYLSQTPESGAEVWKAKLYAGTGVSMEAGKRYAVSFRVRSNVADVPYEACYGYEGEEKGLGALYGLTAGTAEDLVSFTESAGGGCDGRELLIQLNLGNAGAGTTVTIRDISVREIGYVDGESALPEMPFRFGLTGSFRKGNDAEGYTSELTGSASAATLDITETPQFDTADWKVKLFVDTGVTLEAGKTYHVGFRLRGTESQTCTVLCLDNPGNDAEEHRFGIDFGQPISPQGAVYSKTLTPDRDGPLYLQLNLGDTNLPNQISVSSVSVQENAYTIRGGNLFTGKFDTSGAASFDTSYAASLTRNDHSASLSVTNVPDNPDERADWKTKLYIHTGFTPAANRRYRVSFHLKATRNQEKFHILYGYGGGATEKIYGEKWNLSLAAGVEREITHDIFSASGRGELTVLLLLGLIDSGENTFTVSNVSVKEIHVRDEEKNADARIGSARYTAEKGYEANLSCGSGEATLEIVETQEQWREPWKLKLFVDTDLRLTPGGIYRVSMDVSAERDMDYEICYNRDNEEKGYDAIYGLHASADTVKTVEKLFFTPTDSGGELEIQLSLGNVPAPNIVTVQNIRVERVTFSYTGESALPAPLTFRDPGDISYWAHGDYETVLSGTESAAAMRITKAPARGAEPWKIKLFADTRAVLLPGKIYRVSADLETARAQTFEICYNDGGIEKGYDALYNFSLDAGEKRTAEKLITVPPNKTAVGTLTLQFNLGNTTAANTVTVSGIRVEEVPLTYVDVLPRDFSYTENGTVSLWTYDGYTASLDSGNGSAALHMTGVPAAGAEVWQVKLFVNTGVVLSAGRSYRVRADFAAEKAQKYEVCYNNEETEKGYDVLYDQSAPAGGRTAIEKTISVPAGMTDAGRLILQFSVGGSQANAFTVSGVSVQELNFGTGSGTETLPFTVVNGGALHVTREKIAFDTRSVPSTGGENAVRVAGASLCAGERYAVSFQAKADRALTGVFSLRPADGTGAAIRETVNLSPAGTACSFTAAEPLSRGGAYELIWEFPSADGQETGGTHVEISRIAVEMPPETLDITHRTGIILVNGQEVRPDAYHINGSDYYKLRDLALLLNGTDAQFVIRYNKANKVISLTAGKEYVPVGGELTEQGDRSATCIRSPQSVAVNGDAIPLKSYNIGRNNYYRLEDLAPVLEFAANSGGNMVSITSPPTPESQEAAHDYSLFFLPARDGEAQPYVGDTMPYYEDGVYYIYYLKEGGDSYNHSVYLTTTKDFVTYAEQDAPVLEASRDDAQDRWIGTGSVVKVEGKYYFFYTGHTTSDAFEYKETILAAESGNLTSFEKVAGWEILPPAELGQKTDFRDPQAYYDPKTGTISLTVTASQGGTARILKYTLDKNLKNVRYDGIIFTDPTGDYWNLECSDTFQMGNKWYLTYSGQEDTLWYAMADSRFGPYGDPVRLEGKLFYAGKHVEDGENAYMVGWIRRSESASSTREVSGWAGNLMAQKICRKADGSLFLAPVDSIFSTFTEEQTPLCGPGPVAITPDNADRYVEAFPCEESFLLKGEFTCSGTGSFGLAFDFKGNPERYKLLSLDTAEQKIRLSFDGGTVNVAEMDAAIQPGQSYSFTYVQNGSVGIFYLDNEAALAVRLYGVTGKSVSLFAKGGSVTFSHLRQYTLDES